MAWWARAWWAAENWPGVSALPDWQSRFPSWKKKDLAADYGNLGASGVELLDQLLTYEPKLRIVGKDALVHAYFDGFDVESVGKGPLS